MSLSVSCQHAQNMPPPPLYAYGARANDPLRDRLREILTPCSNTLTQLKNARLSASRTDIALAVLAMLLKNLFQQIGRANGTLVASDMETQAAAGRGANGSLCGGMGPATNPQCRLNGIPFGGGHVPGGGREQLEANVDLPEARLTAALDQIDELLWQGRTYESLTDEELDQWARLTDELESGCRQLKEVLND